MVEEKKESREGIGVLHSRWIFHARVLLVECARITYIIESIIGPIIYCKVQVMCLRVRVSVGDITVLRC